MRQVIKHRDIRLLNMIRRTDPVIPKVATQDKVNATDYKFSLVRAVVSLRAGAAFPLFL